MENWDIFITGKAAAFLFPLVCPWFPGESVRALDLFSGSWICTIVMSGTTVFRRDQDVSRV